MSSHRDAPSFREGWRVYASVSVGWFLPSIGDALSLADFRRGCSLFCGQPWVLEVFASPPGTTGLQDGSVCAGPSRVVLGW